MILKTQTSENRHKQTFKNNQKDTTKIQKPTKTIRKTGRVDIMFLDK